MERLTRRELLRELLAAGLTVTAGTSILAGCGSNDKSSPASAASSAGGDSSTGGGSKIRIGFIPLTDCASVVMAHELGLYKKHGIDVEVLKQASWANVRDKLLTGDLEAAHCLFGMPFSVYNGIGHKEPGKELKIAMILNNNGQATTLSQDTFGGKVSYANLPQFKAAVDGMKKAGKTPTFAMTFPGGTHDVWLRYTLLAAGVPLDSVKIITIPPPQMVANMKVGNMDGYNVGEPWGGVAVKQEIGFSFMATQDLWQHHPEKALVCNADFADKRQADLKKVMMAVLEASKWLDDMKNRSQAAEVIGGDSYVKAPADVIDARLMGDYKLGSTLGQRQFKNDMMLFHRDGQTNFPRYSYATWFMAQYVRFGYLKEAPDYDAVAKRLILQDLYREVAEEMKIPVPSDDMKRFALKVDNVPFDPKNPTSSLKQYKVV